ncbi:MAG: ribonuclease P protein component [Oligoflexia bacterium]|nr:ribonuclease P protein component [Oligoflexia bacterium]
MFRLRECVIFRVKNDVGHFRLGITLKSRGSSLERNRTKRRIREAMRSLAAELGSYDYNVVVPGSRKMAFPYPQRLAECLRRDLKNALTTATRK